MTDSNFPAPTVAPQVLTPPSETSEAPVAAPVSDNVVALPTPSADDARSTAEKARTLGAAVPAGLAPKSEVAEDGSRTVVMPYAGHDFKVNASALTGEVYEAMEVGRAAFFIKALIGPEQWALIKGWHMNDIRKFMTELQKLDLLGK